MFELNTPVEVIFIAMMVGMFLGFALGFFVYSIFAKQDSDDWGG